jgi:hypothetical protein
MPPCATVCERVGNTQHGNVQASTVPVAVKRAHAGAAGTDNDNIKFTLGSWEVCQSYSYKSWKWKMPALTLGKLRIKAPALD